MSKERDLLVAVSLTMFFNAFMGNSINIIVPFLAHDYVVSPESITWVINAFTITTAPFLIASSALANFFGFHKIYSLGCILAAICSILIPLTPNFYVLVGMRALQGIIFSLIFCTSMAILVDKTSKEKRAFYIGISTASVYAGLSSSPFIGGVIADTLGWRAIFYLTAVGQIVSFILIRKVSPDRPTTKHLSLGKCTLSFLAGLFVLFGLSYAAEDNRAFILLFVGVILSVIFILIELKSTRPIFPAKLILKNTELNLQLLSSLLNYMSNFAISLLLALHLEIIVGMSATTTGIILIVQPIVMTFASIMSGKLCTRVSSHTLTTLGMLILMIGLYIFSNIEAHTPIAIIVLGQILSGLGFGIFSAPNTNICMSSVQREQYAIVSALLAIARNGGMALSMAILTGILHHFIDASVGTTLYLYELSYAIFYAFLVSVFICALGTITCYLSKRQSKKNMQEMA